MRVARPLTEGEVYVPVADSLAVVPAVLISRLPDEIAPAPSAWNHVSLVSGIQNSISSATITDAAATKTNADG